jgi:hypothetical protein
MTAGPRTSPRLSADYAMSFENRLAMKAQTSTPLCLSPNRFCNSVVRQLAVAQLPAHNYSSLGFGPRSGLVGESTVTAGKEM